MIHFHIVFPRVGKRWLRNFEPPPNLKEAAKEPQLLLVDIPFCNTDWTSIEPTCHQGESGHALWRTQLLGNVRIRMVEYSPGYRADHWCSRGHVVLVLEGVLETELKDGRTFVTVAGMSYTVASNDGEHRSRTLTGAKLFIVD